MSFILDLVRSCFCDSFSNGLFSYNIHQNSISFFYDKQQTYRRISGQWDQIDFENRVLTIPRSKSGEVRHVPLNDDVLSILRGFSSGMTSPWVFPSEKTGNSIDARNFCKRVFRPCLKKAGIEGVTWHTLRHTFASRLVMKGSELRTVQVLMGHKTIAMTQRYSHLSPKHLLSAVNFLNSSPMKPGNKSGSVTKTVTKEIQETNWTSDGSITN